MKFISEAELVERLSRGEEDAYKMLFLRYYMRIFLFANGFVKDADVAEDIAQNVFMKLWLARENISGRSVNNLLFTITKNEVKNWFKSWWNANRTVTGDSFENGGETAPDVDDRLQAQYLNISVNRAMESLSDRRKEIFYLSRVAGLANMEIARMLGISVRTVEKTIQLALREIRSKIGE